MALLTILQKCFKSVIKSGYISTIVARNKICLLVPGTARRDAAGSTNGIYIEHLTKNQDSGSYVPLKDAMACPSLMDNSLL